MYGDVMIRNSISIFQFVRMKEALANGMAPDFMRLKLDEIIAKILEQDPSNLENLLVSRMAM